MAFLIFFHSLKFKEKFFTIYVGVIASDYFFIWAIWIAIRDFFSSFPQLVSSILVLKSARSGAKGLRA